MANFSANDQLTSRNRNLITVAQQDVLRRSVVAFFGMSVGSHAALTWTMQVRPNAIKIADHDVIEASNLNRLRFSIEDIGKQKVDCVQRDILAMSPNTVVSALTITDASHMNQLCRNGLGCDVIVDEIDSIIGKILLRRIARDLQIPLISLADVGENIMIDVERYDLEHDYPFFHGRLGACEQINLEHLTEIEMRTMIIELIGFEHNSEALLQSLLDIGKTITTWPQLGATATISGGVATTLLKKILLNEEVHSGRYYISLDEVLVSDYYSVERQKKRTQLIEEVKHKYQLP